MKLGTYLVAIAISGAAIAGSHPLLVNGFLRWEGAGATLAVLAGYALAIPGLWLLSATAFLSLCALDRNTRREET